MANVEHSRAQRLDQKVVELIPELSRAYGAKLIDQGKVRVNGVIEQKAGYKLRVDDRVAVDFDVKELGGIPEIELEIIYEDDDCVVIDKPLGLLTHSKGVFNPEPTVATWLRSHCANAATVNKPENEDDEVKPNTRAGIVHRLDRATSGVMICAKTPEALSWLQKQFAQRRTKKTYFAVVEGVPSNLEAIIDMPIERNPKAPATFRVGNLGKASKTHYKVVSSNDTHSLLELKPETGRTHQLRVHLAHIGYPIVGDTLYNGQKADRLYLHAAQLEITIVAGHERKVFDSVLPQPFKSMTQ